MKKQILKTVIVTMLLLCSNKMYGQANKKHSFSINFGPEIFVPEKDFWATHKSGGGLSIKTEYTFGKHASATFNTGITFLKGKQKFEDFTSPSPTFYKSITALPLKLGTRYYIGNFYFLGETGIIANLNNSLPTKVVFGAGIGDKIKIGYQKLDVSLRQEMWTANREQLNMALLRIAYEITW
jgi:hypothetical protein